MAQKIIIDTDPGIDDAMAIHFAFAHPDLEVVGLTTVFGNVRTVQATRNALVLAEMAAYPCAVAQGADAPLVQPENDPADFVHGAEGFGEIPAQTPMTAADPRNAAQFICEMAAEFPGEIILCAVAPLTNLALALKHDPAVAQNIKEVILMGGAVDVPGNVTLHAEANIFNDPDAADAVFAADWRITMVGLDVTTKVQCVPEDFTAIRQTSPEIGGFLDEATQFYFDFHRRQHDLNVVYMHDPTAVIACIHPDILSGDDSPIRVICEGERNGKTERAPDSNRRAALACNRVDVDRVREIFLTTLRDADAAKARRSAQ